MKPSARGVDQRVAEADAVLATSEKAADELTGTLADLTARRHALEKAAREHGDRIGRLTDEIAAVAAELAQIEGAQRADLATLASAAETSEAAVAEAEAAALRAEAAHSAARQALDVARGPLAEAERRGATSRHRSQDLGEASAHRHQESVAGGDRRPHRRQGLRSGARRRSRR